MSHCKQLLDQWTTPPICVVRMFDTSSREILHPESMCSCRYDVHIGIMYDNAEVSCFHFLISLLCPLARCNRLNTAKLQCNTTTNRLKALYSFGLFHPSLITMSLFHPCQDIFTLQSTHSWHVCPLEKKRRKKSDRDLCLYRSMKIGGEQERKEGAGGGLNGREHVQHPWRATGERMVPQERWWFRWVCAQNTDTQQPQQTLRPSTT